MTMAVTSLFTTAGWSQNAVQLEIQHLINGVNLSLGENHTVFGTNLEIGRLEYYLCDFTITHDGGQITELIDTYLLVDVNDESPVYSLGDWEITNVEGIEFSVGVDEAHNHLDPATYASGHPLAPQYPSMHWGWASGYRFLALEGDAGENLNAVFEIHALGDNNFFSQSHEVTAEAMSGVVTIPMHANYEKLFMQLNVANGLIEHSSSDEAVTALNNMRDEVFEPGFAAVGVDELDSSSEPCRVFPNPASQFVQLKWADEALGSVYHITDLTGRVILGGTILSQLERLDVARWSPGLYFLHEGSSLQSTRILIQ